MLKLSQISQSLIQGEMGRW